MRILVLGLGNDLLADDAIGILASRRLSPLVQGTADVQETSVAGLALLDFLIGYDRAIILDAVCTGRHAPGTILRLTPDDLAPAFSPSPHYSGLPEVLTLALEMALDVPKDIVILAVEVEDVTTLGGEMSVPVTKALDEIVQRVQTEIGV
ncbi:MAG TPA: hydrogenase maturation protease [bacterium]|nr:hydrogenase maturation protease [bacterium]